MADLVQFQLRASYAYCLSYVRVCVCDADESATKKIKNPHKKTRSSSTKPSNQRYVVETITMTTVTERRIVTDTATTTATAVAASNIPPPVPAKSSSLRKAISSGSLSSTNTDPDTVTTNTTTTTSGIGSDIGSTTYLNSASSDTSVSNSISSQINGILKGGKLWKNEQSQVGQLFIIIFFILFFHRLQLMFNNE